MSGFASRGVTGALAATDAGVDVPRVPREARGDRLALAFFAFFTVFLRAVVFLFAVLFGVRFGAFFAAFLRAGRRAVVFLGLDLAFAFAFAFAFVRVRAPVAFVAFVADRRRGGASVTSMGSDGQLVTPAFASSARISSTS